MKAINVVEVENAVAEAAIKLANLLDTDVTGENGTYRPIMNVVEGLRPGLSLQVGFRALQSVGSL